MKQLTKLSVVVGASLVTMAAQGATAVSDARGNGMGNTGVTTADYLLAPFYNPALVAVYRDRDNIGILFPALGINARDTDESLDTIDSLQDSINEFENTNTPSPELISRMNGFLDDLEDDKPLAISGGAAAAVAIPFDVVSSNFFVRGYAEAIASPEISENTGDTPSAVETRYETSSVDLIAFGYTELGLALAKRMKLGGQDVSFGITPKFQQMRTYKQDISIEDFDISDYDQSETSKNAFNMDLGAVWLYNNYRAGVVVRDLFSQEIDTLDVSGVSTYHLDTQVTLSGAYVHDLFVLTTDWDLTKQKRFSGVSDDTQFLRFGGEVNAWGWAQARIGYEIEMEDTLDDSVTFGVGISPGDLVSFDLAGSYAGDNQFGASANLAFTF